MRIVLFSLLLHVFAALNMTAQSYKIQGKLVDAKEGKNIEIATIELLSADSILIDHSQTNTKGVFKLTSVPVGDYWLRITCLGFQSVSMNITNFHEDIDLGWVYMEESIHDLGNVDVIASRVHYKMDRQLIFPSTAEVEKSTDGIDLLRNMQIHGIEVGRMDNSIKSLKRGGVGLRINGAPADLKDIQALLPQDIIRVEYHDMPSLRYGEVDCVVDYIVRRQESGGSVMASTRNSLHTRWGNEFVGMSLNHKKSRWDLRSSYTYHSYQESYQEGLERFSFQDGHVEQRMEKGIPTNSKEYYYNWALGYSYQNEDKDYLAAQFAYDYFGVPVDNLFSELYYDNGSNLINKSKTNNWKELKPSFNLYYQHKMRNEQLLAFDLVGTYFQTNSDYTYMEMEAGENLSDIAYRTDGKKYSLIIEGLYENTFKSGKLTAGIKQTLAFVDNLYLDTLEQKSRFNNYQTYAYLEWAGKISKLGYSLGVGATYTRMSQELEVYDDVRFTPTWLLNYAFSDNLQLRYQGRLSTTSVPMGSLNAVDIYMDTYQIRRGNVDLRPTTNYYNNLSFSYNKGIWNMTLEAYDSYSPNPIMEMIYRENNLFIRQMINAKKAHEFATSAFLRSSPFNGRLSVYVSASYNWMRNVYPDRSQTLRNFVIGGGISGMIKSFTLYGDITTRRKMLIGETLLYGEQFASAGVDYRWRSLNIGLGVMCRLSGDVWRNETLNPYLYSDLRSYNKDTKNIVFIKCSYNIDFGKQKNNSQKRLYNDDYDSGTLK